MARRWIARDEIGIGKGDEVVGVGGIVGGVGEEEEQLEEARMPAAAAAPATSSPPPAGLPREKSV
jgi:pyruvate/2-oxoglutarate dehydrogenase complex dihydrolipoamide acyltransferase (E2) component